MCEWRFCIYSSELCEWLRLISAFEISKIGLSLSRFVAFAALAKHKVTHYGAFFLPGANNYETEQLLKGVDIHSVTGSFESPWSAILQLSCALSRISLKVAVSLKCNF